MEQQLAQVEEYVNQRSERDSDFDTQFQELSIAIDELRTNISSTEANALAHIETQINALTERLDNMQALDLRWAIVGVLIAACGVAVSYWA
jgi:septal ring factor EnvC (AmiA/AmiB activator)